MLFNNCILVYLLFRGLLLIYLRTTLLGTYISPVCTHRQTPCKPQSSRSHPARCVLSRFSHVQLFITPWTVAHQAPLSMGFYRQEYWSGLPCPFPEDLPNSGLEPISPASTALQANSLLQSHQGTQRPAWSPVHFCSDQYQSRSRPVAQTSPGISLTIIPKIIFLALLC